MKIIKIRIDGLPVAKQRVKRSMHGFNYLPKKTKDFEAKVRSNCIMYRPASLPKGPIALILTFCMPRPASLPKRHTFHIKRPDFDNLEKSICDGLKKGGIYKDDSQVFMCMTQKVYSDHIGVDVKVVYIEDETYSAELYRHILTAEAL